MPTDRSEYIGGTDCAAIMGMSRWKTILQIWAEKTKQIVPEEKDSEAKELGKELENYVAKRFMKKTGKKVQRVNEVQQHQYYSFLRAQIDRKVIGEDAVLECKTTSAWKAKEWEGQEIPQEYILQCLHQLLVTGKQKAYIAVLIGNQDFKWKEINRDEKLIGEIFQRELDFWNNFVIPKIMPVQISYKDSDALYQIFGEGLEGSEIVLGDEANQLIEAIQAAQQEEKSIQALIGQKKNMLKAMLGKNETAQTNLYKITWKEKSVEEHLVKGFKTRVLTIREKGDKENG